MCRLLCNILCWKMHDHTIPSASLRISSFLKVEQVVFSLQHSSSSLSPCYRHWHLLFTSVSGIKSTACQGPNPANMGWLSISNWQIDSAGSDECIAEPWLRLCMVLPSRLPISEGWKVPGKRQQQITDWRKATSLCISFQPTSPQRCPPWEQPWSSLGLRAVVAGSCASLTGYMTHRCTGWLRRCGFFSFSFHLLSHPSCWGFIILLFITRNLPSHQVLGQIQPYLSGGRCSRLVCELWSLL